LKLTSDFPVTIAGTTRKKRRNGSKQKRPERKEKSGNLVRCSLLSKKGGTNREVRTEGRSKKGKRVVRKKRISRAKV